MKLARYAVVATLVMISGCVTGYTIVEPGVQTLGSMRVTADANWNKAPAGYTSSGRSNSRTWTQDGLLLDRIMIIPRVPDGEPILRSRDKSTALPVFRADMLPNEIEEVSCED